MVGLKLLAEAHEAGLEVLANGDKLVIRGPRRAAAVAERLLAHKPEVMAALVPALPCGRCSSTRTVDVPIHNGRSVRRDCAKCGRFIEFPIWRGVAL